MAWGNWLWLFPFTSPFFPLSRRVIPVVMGARLEEYEAVAPHNSFIHVDQFKGPRELAEYLDQLDQDDDLYNEYFQGIVNVVKV